MSIATDEKASANGHPTTARYPDAAAFHPDGIPAELKGKMIPWALTAPAFMPNGEIDKSPWRIGLEHHANPADERSCHRFSAIEHAIGSTPGRPLLPALLVTGDGGRVVLELDDCLLDDPASEFDPFSDDDEPIEDPDAIYVDVEMTDGSIARKRLASWAAMIVEGCDSHASVSTLVTGIRVIVRGRLPVAYRKASDLNGDGSGSIEFMADRRFVTLTGQLVEGRRNINDAQEVLTALFEQFIPEDRRKPDDESEVVYHLDDFPERTDKEVLALARSGARHQILKWASTARKHVGRFAKLEMGDDSDYGHDGSRADYALFWEIVPYTGPNLDQAERIIRSLGRARARADKWDQKRGQSNFLRYDLKRFIKKMKAADYWRGPRKPGGEQQAPPADDEPSFKTTDLGNCERFARDHAAHARHVGSWKKWLVYANGRWITDETGAVVRLAKQTVRGIAAEAAEVTDPDQFKAILKWAIKSEDARQIANMIRLAESEKRIAVSHRRLNADPWLFNVRNGTIDLRTGELKPHDRADLITHLAPVEFAPSAACPLWESELQTVFAGDAELIAFFQRLVGYWMTGAVRDQILPIAYGKGRNGKSTVIGTLLRIFGEDYSYEADPALIMQRSSNDHPTEKAALFGKRMVSLSETDSGKRLNEALVKRLTGKEQITARRMREDPWSFWPTHKLILSTNHRPEIRGTDTAIWRRVLLIPFTVTIDPKDEITDFSDRLRAEDSGILGWCVRGCLDWQRQGLNPPESVIAATKDYRESQDALSSFITERCFVGPDFKWRSGEFYKAYCDWAKENGEETLGSRTFYEAMAERGHPSKIGQGNRRFMERIGLRPND